MGADFTANMADQKMPAKIVVEPGSVNTRYDELFVKNAKVVVSVSMAGSGSSAENAKVVLFVSTVDNGLTAKIVVGR